MPLGTQRLGVGDDAADAGKAVLEAGFDAVDFVVDLLHGVSG